MPPKTHTIIDCDADVPVREPHVLWLGCGDLLKKTNAGLEALIEQYDGNITFADVMEPELVSGPVPASADFFNLSLSEKRDGLRMHLHEKPLSHVFVANWAPIHLLTAYKFSEMCNGGRIIISKPLDTNLQLIETIRKGSQP